MHEFDILQVVSGRAGGNFRRLVAHAIRPGEIEFVESREEVIMARTFRWSPVAHGPGIDELVEENLVAISAAHPGLTGIHARFITRWPDQRGGGAVYAEIV